MFYTPEYTQSHEIEDYFQHTRRVTSVQEQIEAEVEESYVRTMPGIWGIERDIDTAERETYGYSVGDIEAAEMDEYGMFTEAYGKKLPYLSEEDFKASPDYRKGFKYDSKMTPVRLAVMAKEYDKHEERQNLLNRVPQTAGRKMLSFGAGLVGSLPDPLNFVGFGEIKAGATIGKVLMRGAAEGAVGNALADAVAVPYLNDMGYDIGAQEVFTDIAFGAILGGGLPAVAKGVKGGIDSLRFQVDMRSKGKLADMHSRAIDSVNEGRMPTLDDADIDIIREIHTIPRMGEEVDMSSFSRMEEGGMVGFKEYESILRAEPQLRMEAAQSLGDLASQYQVSEDYNVVLTREGVERVEGVEVPATIEYKRFEEADVATERFSRVLDDIVNECF